MTDAPDAVVEHRPRACAACGEGLFARPCHLHARHQVVDLPPVPLAYVTEHRVLACRCTCGHTTVAERPADLPPRALTSYGPGVEALVAYLSARHYLPVARLAELMRDVLAVPIATGTVQAILGRAAHRLAGTLAAIKARVAGAAVVGADETPIRERGRRRDAWVWHSRDAAYLARGPGRGSEVHRREFPGGFERAHLLTDRLAAQLNTPAGRGGQVCLAHVLRRLRGLGERRGATWWCDELGELLTEVMRRGAAGRSADPETAVK